MSKLIPKGADMNSRTSFAHSPISRSRGFRVDGVTEALLDRNALPFLGTTQTTLTPTRTCIEVY